MYVAACGILANGSSDTLRPVSLAGPPGVLRGSNDSPGSTEAGIDDSCGTDDSAGDSEALGATGSADAPGPVDGDWALAVTADSRINSAEAATISR